VRHKGRRRPTGQDDQVFFRICFYLQGRRTMNVTQISARAVTALAFAATVLVNGAAECQARVKLITLPVRERVEIQLDNPGATLVEEERIVPLVKGDNQVDFSWANTQIDPNTIVFRVLSAEGAPAVDAKVLSVSYPPGEAALVWAVGASESGSARVRISYLLGNLTKSFNYRAVASHDETTLELSQYLRLQNFANEQFDGAGVWAGFGPRFSKPIGINETKEMLLEKFVRVPVEKRYTCDPEEYDYLDRGQNKLRVPMHYVLKNDKEHGLGAAALPFGKVRIFIKGAAAADEGSTTFLGEDWGKFTPKDDEMRLYLGVAQDVVVKRTIEKHEVKRVTGNLFDHEVIIKYEIENFKKQPVTLDLVERPRHVRSEMRGDNGRDVQWELGPQTTLGDADPERSQFDQLTFHVELPAADSAGKADKQVHKLHLVLKNEW
jgi:hypothetical protein